MPISSNSVIHFTNNIETLKKIVTEGFKIKYCVEVIKTKEGNYSPAVPIVSFCDIPLSHLKDHLEKYGNYGIGLSKEWAIQKGLNPVLYLEKNSSLASNFKLSTSAQIRPLQKKWSDFDEHEKNLMDIFRYIKNYESELIRKGKTINNYRFYDEREWRYSPPHDDCKRMVLTKNQYKEERLKSLADKSIEHLRLTFDVSDIIYLILENDSEVVEFVKWMRDNYSERVTDANILKLTSRIITVDRIKTDF
jgi:hypothetical protein